MPRERIVQQVKFKKRDAPLLEPHDSKTKEALDVEEVFLDEQGLVERDGKLYEYFVVRGYKPYEEE